MPGVNIRKDDTVVQVEAIFAASEYMGQAATLVTVLDIGDRLRLETPGGGGHGWPDGGS